MKGDVTTELAALAALYALELELEPAEIMRLIPSPPTRDTVDELERLRRGRALLAYQRRLALEQQEDG